MENPWTKKGRLFWKNDPEYQKFNQQLYTELWTFEEIVKIAKINEIVFLKETKLVYQQMKGKWLEYVRKWNEIENITETDKTKGFMALTYMFIVLPYHEIDNIGKYFTKIETNHINICYFYETDGNCLPFEDNEELLNCPPFHPSAYQEWIERKCDSACWWISYMVFEKNHSLTPIIDSEPAKLLT